MRLALIAAAAALAAACSSGSSTPPAPIPCDLAHPCPPGGYCQADVCVPPEELLCVPVYMDCPLGYVCGESNLCMVPPPPLLVAIVSPASSVLTNATVHFVVSVTNGTAGSVYLRRNGSYLGAVVGGVYDWNTSGTPEGTHTVVAVATRGSESFESAPLSVTVDRTGPSIASSAPAHGAADVRSADPVSLVLSEAVLPQTLAGAVTVRSGVSTIPSTATLRLDGRTVDVSFAPPATRPVSVTVAIGPPLADVLGNVASAASVTFTYPAWIPLGPPVYVARTGGIADLAVDGSARPVVALIDRTGPGPVVRVSRFEAGAWQPLGAQVNAAGSEGANASLAVDAAGRPVVAYVENLYSLRVKRWDGAAWLPLGGGISPGTYSVGGTSVAFMSDGEPVVAYSGYDASPTAPQIYAKRWDAVGAAWTALGGALNPDLTRPATGPSMAVDPAGRPVVAFEQWGASGAPFQLHVRRWEGGAWAALGGNLAPNPATHALYPSAAIDGTGAPLVALGNGGNGYVLRWDAASPGWVAQGGALSPVTSYGQLDAALAVDGSGRMLVAFDVDLATGDRFYVSALDAGTWGEIAPTPSTPGERPWTIDLALEPSGVAVVGFCEQVVIAAGPPEQTEMRCYVRREDR